MSHRVKESGQKPSTIYRVGDREGGAGLKRMIKKISLRVIKHASLSRSQLEIQDANSRRTHRLKADT